MVNVVVAGGDETFEQRVRLVWFALEFRVELAGDEKRMIFQLDYFHQLSIRGKPAEDEPGLFEALTIGVVELVAMPMAFVNKKCTVEMVGQRAHNQLARLRAQSHRAAFLGNLFL